MPMPEEDTGGFERIEKQPASWGDWFEREGGILGSHMLAPLAGAPAAALGLPGWKGGGMLPLPSDVRALGATPQGMGENVLATAGTAAGAALGPAALLAGAVSPEAAAVPAALYAMGAPLVGRTALGGALGETRRQMLPDLPGGPVVDAALGGVAGGASATGGPVATAGTAALAAAKGVAADTIAASILRHAVGMSPMWSDIIGGALGVAAGAAGSGRPVARFSPMGATAGALGAVLPGPPPQP